MSEQHEASPVVPGESAEVPPAAADGPEEPPGEAGGLPADPVPLTDATTAVADARTALADATTALDQALLAQQAAEKAVTDLRAALGTSAMRADADATSADLEAAMATARRAQAVVTTARDGVVKATVTLATATAAMDWATATAAADTAAATADAADTTAHTAWHDRLAQAPLDTLRADAETARTTDSAAALDRLHALLPPPLVDAAEGRGRDELTRRAGLQEAAEAADREMATARAAAGPDDALVVAEAAYRAAEARLLAYVQDAPARLDAARAALATVRAAPALPEQERTHIDTLGAGDDAHPEPWLVGVPDAAFALIADHVAADAELAELAAADPAALQHAVSAAHDGLVAARAGAQKASWTDLRRRNAVTGAAARIAAEQGFARNRLVSAVRGDAVTP